MKRSMGTKLTFHPGRLCSAGSIVLLPVVLENAAPFQELSVHVPADRVLLVTHGHWVSLAVVRHLVNSALGGACEW